MGIQKKSAHASVRESHISKDQVLSKALIRASDSLGISRQELCAVTGMSEATLSRLYDHKRFIHTDSKEGELSLLFLRAYRSLDALFGGNPEQCRDWLRAYNSHLNEVPINLIKTIQGLNEVTIYLDAVRGKI